MIKLQESAPDGVFVTGTGTDVGKTVIAALLLRQLRAEGVNAGYFKAAQSGAHRENGRLVPEDAAYVCKTARLPAAPEHLVPYVYEMAASPHLAAQTEGNPVVLEEIARHFTALRTACDYMVAEGSGGLVCPLRLENGRSIMLTDVVRLLGLPLLIVSDAGLGAINHTVLTVEYARAQKLPIAGIVLNRFVAGDPIHEDNRMVIPQLTGVPILFEVPLQ